MVEVWKFAVDLLFGDAKQRFNAAKYISDFVAMITRAITVLVIYSFWMKLPASERPLTHWYLQAMDLFIQYSLMGYALALMLATGSIVYGVIDRASDEKYTGENAILRMLFPIGSHLVRFAIFLIFISSMIMIVIGFVQAQKHL